MKYLSDFKDLLKTFNFPGWKIMAVSFGLVFLMSALSHLPINFRRLGISGAQIAKPAPQPPSIFDQIRAKLKVQGAVLRLKQPQPELISQVSAAEINVAGLKTQDYQQAKAYGVIDLNNGDIIASKNLGQAQPIASLTKIMSVVIALDLISPTELMTVSERAAKIQPTKIGVVPTQKMSVKELVSAMLLTSANDAAQVIREGVDQKYQAGTFVQAMNEKAELLGLDHSHFANAQGFDNPRNYSSIEDLAVLSDYALRNYPLISELVQKDYLYLPTDNNHKQFDLYNWNGLLTVYPGASGIKIGNTDDAGFTTVVSASRNGHRLIAIVLGAPGVLERDLWASSLLDLGFQKQYNLQPVNITEQTLKQKYATWKYWN